MSDAEGAAECFYTLDADDCIVDCGGPAWNALAADKCRPELAGGQVKGQSIYAHVAGHFTQRFLREFFNAARTEAAQVSRAYRCDAPHVKRLMEMRAYVQDGGLLRVEHRVIAESAIEMEFDPHVLPAERRADFLRCAMCARLRESGAEDWREPDRPGAPGSLHIVHTVCQGCRSGIAARSPRRPECAA